MTENERECTGMHGSGVTRMVHNTFVVENEEKPGMRGMNVVHIQLFFPFHTIASYIHMLSSSGSQELADRLIVRQGCGRFVWTSDKVSACAQSFILIPFCAGSTFSPFSGTAFYL